MKKTLTIIFICIGLSVSAQTKKDTLTKNPPPDSLKILSVKDLLTFLKFLKDNATVTVYSQLTPDNVIAELYGWAIKEYQKPPIKK